MARMKLLDRNRKWRCETKHGVILDDVCRSLSSLQPFSNPPMLHGSLGNIKQINRVFKVKPLLVAESFYPTESDQEQY